MTEDEEMSDLDKRFLDTVEKQILADVPRDSRLTNFSRLRVEDALRVVSLAQAPQAENERLREALVLVLDSVEGCHDCWRLMATDDEKAQIRAALEGE